MLPISDWTVFARLCAPLLALITTIGVLNHSASLLGEAVSGWDLARRYVDDASYVEHVLHRFRPTVPAVVFLGGSVTREGVPEDVQMAELLQARLGSAREVRNLAYSSFSPVEALAIVETLTVPPGSMVTIQLSWQNLIDSRAAIDSLVRRPRIALLQWGTALELASPAVRLEVALTPTLIRHSAVIANYLDQRSCRWYRLAVSADREVCLRPTSVQRNFYSLETQLSDAQKQASVAVAHAELVPQARNNWMFAEAIYARIIERSLARGFHPVLLMWPRDPAEAQAMVTDQLDELEQQTMERLARLTDTIDLRGSGELVAADFADPLHLLESGRTKIALPLAVRIAAIFDRIGQSQKL